LKAPPRWMNLRKQGKQRGRSLRQESLARFRQSGVLQIQKPRFLCGRFPQIRKT
jgi:hypothetical protein